MRRTMRRIGPQMEAARDYVKHHPGCTQQEVAIAIGPHGSHQYGSRVVQRALAAGLIRNEEKSPRRYRLFAN